MGLARNNRLEHPVDEEPVVELIVDEAAPAIEDVLLATDIEGSVAVTAPTPADQTGRRARERKPREPLCGRESSAQRVHTVRTKVGTRRRRRWDNFRGLQETAHRLGVVHEDVSLLPDSQSCLSRLLTDSSALEAWTLFSSHSADEQAEIVQMVKAKSKRRLTEQRPDQYDPKATLEERLSRIDRAARNKLRKSRVPQGGMACLEKMVVDAFEAEPDTVLVSELPDSFARFLLHCLCRYHGLHSESDTVQGTRITTVHHPNPELGFQRAPIALYEIVTTA